MKISIFGDSYGAQWGPNQGDGSLWVDQLRARGYSITNYSQPGSSVWYSWRKYQQHHYLADIVIFLITGPFRITLNSNLLPKEICHVTDADKWAYSPGQYGSVKVEEINKIRESLMQVRLYQDSKVMEQGPYQLLLDRLISLARESKPMLVLPCMPTHPWPHSLYSISQIEPQRFNIKLNEDYRDFRPGHLSPENNSILADRIAQWIETGQTVDLDPTSYCQETKSKLLDMFDPV